MKSRIRILAAGTLLFLSAIFAQKSMAQQYVSLQVFYDQLSPYGQWLDNPEYGYVWLPDAGPDFVPYGSMGHWIFTDYGWTWVSGYEWGWATFHYGRWDFDNYYGWYWIPDNEWGPAWVSWRRADGYYGWEPMGPGISITISFGRQYDRGHDHWIFVRDRDFDRQDINQYYVDRSQNSTIVVNSTIINNTYIDNSRNTTYVTGPDRDAIQKETGRRVKSVTIREESRPGQKMENGSLHIYRPQVSQNNDRDQKPAPSKYTHYKEVTPVSERMNEPRQENNVNQDKGNTLKKRYGNQTEKAMTPQNRSANESKTEKVNQPVRVAPENRPANETRPAENNNAKRNQSGSAAPENHPAKETRPVDVNTEKRNQSGSAAPENHPAKETKPPEINTEKGNQPERVAPENHPANETRPADEQKSQNEGNTQNKSASPQKSDQTGTSTGEKKSKNKKGSGKSGEAEKSNSNEK